MLLPQTFYQCNTKSLAKKLLGCFLACDTEHGRCIGRIVETEAYLFRGDPACHASRGMTKRNAAMFGPAGTAYVYLIYGMHLCFNVVSGKEGEGEAVLIRALEPWQGLELMRTRRARSKKTSPAETDLCSGPAKLVHALGIDLTHNGSSLRSGPVRLYDTLSFPKKGKNVTRSRIVQTSRIGISQGVELPLRFYFANNEFISRP